MPPGGESYARIRPGRRILRRPRGRADQGASRGQQQAEQGGPDALGCVSRDPSTVISVGHTEPLTWGYGRVGYRRVGYPVCVAPVCWVSVCCVSGHRRACSIVFIRPISPVWSASTSEANLKMSGSLGGPGNQEELTYHGQRSFVVDDHELQKQAVERLAHGGGQLSHLSLGEHSGHELVVTEGVRLPLRGLWGRPRHAPPATAPSSRFRRSERCRSVGPAVASPRSPSGWRAGQSSPGLGRGGGSSPA